MASPMGPSGYDQLPTAAEPSSPEDDAIQRKIEKRKVRIYQAEIDAGCHVWDKWNTDYKCDQLEDYYTGIGHWEEAERSNYTINLCYSKLEARIPSLMFYNPRVRVKPKPARADDPFTAIDERSKLLEDTADCLMNEEKVGFFDATQLALREAHYRFGIVQVGYTADYIDNPGMGKPMLDDETKEPMIGSDGIPVEEGPYLLQEESLYVKRIPAATVRVPVNGRNIPEHNDWIAYYEFVSVDDIRKNPRYSNVDKVKSTAKMKKEFEEHYYESDDKEETIIKRHDMVKIWRCWDFRSRTFYIWPDGGNFFLIPGEPFAFWPCAVLKFHERMDEFYPLPPLMNWISPQDELNETRQMQRVHRRRFKRRFLRTKGFCSPAEWDKLEQGDDGTCVEVNNLDGLRAVEDAPLDTAIARNIPTTREDFTRVSGVGGEAENIPESQTATQAALIDNNTKVRETFARATVGKWLAKIVKLIILTARERMALPMWIERNVDPLSPGAQEEVMRVATTWAAITHEDLGDFDFDVSVDLETLTPETREQERDKFMQVLGMVTQPQNAILLSASPTLLKRVLDLWNIRGARDVAEISQAIQITAMAMAGMANGTIGGPGAPGGGPGGSPGGGRKPGSSPTPKPGPIPQPGDMMSQLMGNLGLGGPVKQGMVH